MKITSWNVNGIRAVEKKGFVEWLLASGSDVVCIQETKACPEQLGKNLTEPGSESEEDDDDAPLFASVLESSKKGPVYHSYFSSAVKKGYSGTAVYSLKAPDRTETLGIKEFDDEGRTVFAFFGKLCIISAYFPNSQNEGKRLEYKTAFCKAIHKKCLELVKDGYHIVLCGDYNIAHEAKDLANPKQNEGNAGYLPEEREWMDYFVANGFKDSFRLFNSEGGNYSWWSYRTNARERNIGWRIDYLCVDDGFVPMVKSSSILSHVEGSDHCPVEIEIDYEI